MVTINKNKISTPDGRFRKEPQICSTPRGQLHMETVYGKIRQYKTKMEKVGTKFDKKKIDMVANESYRLALEQRLEHFSGNPKKAFGGANSPTKKPIYLNDGSNKALPEKIKLVWLEDQYTIRKEITPDLKIEKVIDGGVRSTLQQRLNQHGGDAKKAFGNLSEHPIWLDKDNGISLKRVTIRGVNHAESLHYKKDHHGRFLLDEKGAKIPVDFVSTGNNHHVAVYRDNDGNLQEDVVSFYEAVIRANAGLPIVKTEHELGWDFLFTMKQNEYFIFPSENFDPKEIDLLDPKNSTLISPHLFRVQKITVKNYMFRHHLETLVETQKELSDVTYKHIQSLPHLENVVKVHLNRLGEIIKTGE